MIDVDELYKRLQRVYRSKYGITSPLNDQIKELMDKKHYTFGHAVRSIAVKEGIIESIEVPIQEWKTAMEHRIRECETGIERLTRLFSKGEISEESYKKAIKTLEEELNELKRKKEEGPIEPKSLEEMGEREIVVSKPSALWYLVPFFFGVLGGIVAYAAVRKEDRDMAESLLIFGIVWSIVLFLTMYWVISMLLSPLASL